MKGRTTGAAHIGTTANIKSDDDDETKIATIEERNYFEKGNIVQIFGPNEEKDLVIEAIYNENLEEIDAARHPKEIIKIKVPFKVYKDDLVRVKRV